MPLRPLLACLVLLSSVAGLRAAEFDWPRRGAIRIEVAEGWQVEGRAVDDLAYALRGTPKSGAAALLQVTVVQLPDGKSIKPAELPERLHESLRPFLAQSVEKEFHPVKLRCRQGQGWFAELTDASLVGKPPVANDYKVIRNALIALDARTLVIAIMQLDDPDGPEAGEMLALICSLQVERPDHGG